MLDDPRPSIRQGAISRVREFGTNALPAAPKLIALLNGSDDFCAMWAAQTLGELQLRQDLCIPALTNALQNSRFEVALAAHSSLAEFGLVFPIPQDVRSRVPMRKRQP
jgi:HEAT repeat protein